MLGWSNCGSGLLVFFVNKNILLCGVYLFGSEGNDYIVILNIFWYFNYVIIVFIEGIYLFLYYKLKNYWGFDVLFDFFVFIIKGNSYCIDVDISGFDFFGRRNGSIYVESLGVIFIF